MCAGLLESKVPRISPFELTLRVAILREREGFLVDLRNTPFSELFK